MHGGRGLARRLIEVRESPIHGRGVFAVRPIARGTRIIEYTGQRISWEEADRREALKAEDDTHTMLFTVDKKTVIDATNRGSNARFINHSCLGNCKSYNDESRIFIEARRAIAAGEELAYDYKLSMDGQKLTRALKKQYACRCGAATCRGTLLFEPKKRKVAVVKDGGKKRGSSVPSGVGTRPEPSGKARFG